MVAGSAVPPLTASYSGFVNGDNSSVLSGAPSLSTTATPASPPGAYPISVAQGTLSAANYTFTFVAGTLTVTPATSSATTTAVASSADPSVYAQPVTFTATVSAVSGAGTPTGTVTFKDGRKVLATEPLVNGQATFTTDALKRGSHAITASYGGDGTFLASASPALTQKVKTVALEPDPLVPGKMDLFVGGTAGDDLIEIGSARGGRRVVVSVQETGPGSFSFQHSYATAGLARVVVFGGAGDDTLLVDPDVKLPALLFGGAGNDYLQGGGGPSVLVGGSGDDILVGGSGRNILIGGGGTDLLFGGDRGNILIGGTTNYDSNVTALSSLMAEWGRTDESYRTRVSHLLGTTAGGANGTFYLNPNTVHDDGAFDLLVGGRGRDWFFASAAGQDLLLNRRHGEVVTKVS
jgi:Ca2+-binding RTX toxin-like protein